MMRTIVSISLMSNGTTEHDEIDAETQGLESDMSLIHLWLLARMAILHVSRLGLRLLLRPLS